MKEISLLQKEFPISYALACFPYGYGNFIFYFLLALLFFYYAIYLRFKSTHMANKDVKIQKTETKFSDLIGILDNINNQRN